MSQKIKRVMHFHNGNIAVFDEHEQQIPELQKQYHEIWAEHAVRQGYNPEGLAWMGWVLSYHKEADESGWWMKMTPQDYAKKRR